MPNEIYHRSNWGNANAEGFGDVYFDASATNKLYNHSDYYENSDGTDKILRDIPNKASIVLTPTAYSDGSLNTVIPPYQVLPTELVTNGDFSDGTNDWIASNSTLSLDNGYLKITSTGGNRPQAYQTVLGLIAGKKYRLSAEAKRGTCVNEVEIEISGIGSTVDTNKNNTTEFKNIFYEFTATSTTHIIQAKIDDGASTVGETAFFKIVNLKEIQEADFDFSRGSSATRVNEKGLIEDVASGIPRIDYTTGFGSLLLEPQRTNLITYSEDLTQWQKLNSTVTDNSIVSPDGTQNADLVNYSITSGNGYIRLAHTASQTVTFYIKYKDLQWIMVYGSGLGAGKFIDIKNNIIGGNVGSGATAEIVDANNGWKRVTLSSTSANITQTSIYAASSDGSYATITITGGIYLWGAQAEAGSYPTSYIVSNSGSATTRSADVANNSGNADLFNDSEGVLYAEIAALTDVDGDASLRFISLSNGTSSKRITIYYFSSETFGVQLKNDGYEVTDLYIGGSVDRTQFNKIALYYSGSNVKAYLNGIEVFTNSSWIPFPDNTINTLTFTDGSLSNLPFYGKTKELAVFKEALTDAELESLTSWISFTEMATDLEYTVE